MCILGMSDYSEILKERKRENETLSQMNTMQKNYDRLFEENYKLKLQIKELAETIKKNKDINDVRFGEVYAFLTKIEQSYYKGITEGVLEPQPDMNEAKIKKNLFGNMGMLNHNESLFIHTKQTDMESMKKAFM